MISVIEQIADEMGISVSRCLGILEFIFEHPEYMSDGYLVVDEDEVMGRISTGKRDVRSFLKKASSMGVISKRVVYSIPYDVQLDESGSVATITKLKQENILPFLKYHLDSNIDVEPVKSVETVEEAHRAATIKSEKEDYWINEMNRLSEESWFPNKLREMSMILADENKTGKVSARKVVSKIYAPLVSAQGKFTREALEYGISTAIANGAANATYAKKCAKSYEEKYGKLHICEPAENTLITDDGRPIGKYDKWALNDPRYREKYIDLFGGRQ